MTDYLPPSAFSARKLGAPKPKPKPAPDRTNAAFWSSTDRRDPFPRWLGAPVDQAKLAPDPRLAALVRENLDFVTNGTMTQTGLLETASKALGRTVSLGELRAVARSIPMGELRANLKLTATMKA